ncbi:transcriptional regulator [Pseudomonas daroniae]|uniref:Transcriptional regulator n=1 Tax=Phytopseudomonas daroniae TaxID=2487519 RepID=A0A4Q9QG26_9GAMM|nr:MULTISPECIES: GntR family transcriptional regulator [Pseudomonas]TBU72406.1 transcriptional regulator [Pseudomonas daroniae]TBU74260.1 transcriptional regulator [Pseudomonas sp. FRB 228]TBU86530.1 transcriptional regulator [Pseudomonas daroniae]
MVAKNKTVGVTLAPMSNMESAQHAADQIRAAIIQGQFRPGDRLIEKQLTEQLNLSRHPVREALRSLSREGLVEMRVNRGAVVAELDTNAILEVYSIRSVLGKLALKALITTPKALTPAVLKKLEALAKKAIKLARQENQANSIANDMQFQSSIVQASGLERCARYFDELTAEVHRFNNLSRIAYIDREADAINYILGLYEAIEARDLSKAEGIWQRKFSRAAERFIEHTTVSATADKLQVS